MTNREILAKYPYLKDPGIASYATAPDATWASNVPIGWRNRFFELCDTINDQLAKNGLTFDQFNVLQVKEKFGALRFYWVPADGFPAETYKAISDAIDKCEVDTARICFLCGKPAKYLSTGGWVAPYCPECAQEWVDTSNDRYPANPTSVEKSFTEISELR